MNSTVSWSKSKKNLPTDQDNDNEAHEEKDEDHGVDDGQPVDLKTTWEEVDVMDQVLPVCITDPVGYIYIMW